MNKDQGDVLLDALAAGLQIPGCAIWLHVKYPDGNVFDWRPPRTWRHDLTNAARAQESAEVAVGTQLARRLLERGACAGVGR